MLRTIWWRNALAVASIMSQSPRRETISRSMRRTGDFA